jgi:hypothetical protein
MITDLDQRRHALALFFHTAQDAVDALPPGPRADALEGMAIAAEGTLDEVALEALRAASALREAEERQMTMKKLLADFAQESH